MLLGANNPFQAEVKTSGWKQDQLNIFFSYQLDSTLD